MTEIIGRSERERERERERKLGPQTNKMKFLIVVSKRGKYQPDTNFIFEGPP